LFYAPLLRVTVMVPLLFDRRNIHLDPDLFRRAPDAGWSRRRTTADVNLRLELIDVDRASTAPTYTFALVTVHLGA